MSLYQPRITSAGSNFMMRRVEGGSNSHSPAKNQESHQWEDLNKEQRKKKSTPMNMEGDDEVNVGGGEFEIAKELQVCGG